jgi:hypothetical protein
MDIPECRVVLMPMTIEAGLALFDPFFSELRYPQEFRKLGGVGEDGKVVLDELVGACLLKSAHFGEVPPQ